MDQAFNQLLRKFNRPVSFTSRFPRFLSVWRTWEMDIYRIKQQVIAEVDNKTKSLELGDRIRFLEYYRELIENILNYKKGKGTLHEKSLFWETLWDLKQFIHNELFKTRKEIKADLVLLFQEHNKSGYNYINLN